MARISGDPGRTRIEHDNVACADNGSVARYRGRGPQARCRSTQRSSAEKLACLLTASAALRTPGILKAALAVRRHASFSALDRCVDRQRACGPRPRYRATDPLSAQATLSCSIRVRPGSPEIRAM